MGDHIMAELTKMSPEELDNLRKGIDREHFSRFEMALHALCRQFGYQVETTLQVFRPSGEISEVHLVVEY
jgi:hypothetical protein